MNQALRASQVGVTVVALGPLTNVAIAIRTDPDLWRIKCKKIVWMGGSVVSGGNSTAWAEANAFGDPEAAHIVLTSGLPILLYPWDVFLHVQYSRQELEALRLERPASALASRLLDGLMRLFRSD